MDVNSTFSTEPARARDRARGHGGGPAGGRLPDGPLAGAGGVAVVDGLPDPGTTGALLAEAMALYPNAEAQTLDRHDGATGRGGVPDRRLRTSGGGPVQDAFYAAPWLSNFLSSVCGAPVVPTGGRGSYSFYVEQGDYLGLHLDIDACDVTLITVLRDDAPPSDPSGGLLVHPGYLGGNLNEVRRCPDPASGLIKATPGQSIVLLGGLLPHETVPVNAGHPRVISALCFRAEGSVGV